MNLLRRHIIFHMLSKLSHYVFFVVVVVFLQYHSVNSFQKDSANEQSTNRCEIDCSVTGQNGQIGESIFFIL